MDLSLFLKAILCIIHIENNKFSYLFAFHQSFKVQFWSLRNYKMSHKWWCVIFSLCSYSRLNWHYCVYCCQSYVSVYIQLQSGYSWLHWSILSSCTVPLYQFECEPVEEQMDVSGIQIPSIRDFVCTFVYVVYIPFCMYAVYKLNVFIL